MILFKEQKKTSVDECLLCGSSIHKSNFLKSNRDIYCKTCTTNNNSSTFNFVNLITILFGLSIIISICSISFGFRHLLFDNADTSQYSYYILSYCPDILLLFASVKFLYNLSKNINNDLNFVIIIISTILNFILNYYTPLYNDGISQVAYLLSHTYQFIILFNYAFAIVACVIAEKNKILL